MGCCGSIVWFKPKKVLLFSRGVFFCFIENKCAFTQKRTLFQKAKGFLKNSFEAKHGLNFISLAFTSATADPVGKAPVVGVAIPLPIQNSSILKYPTLYCHLLFRDDLICVPVIFSWFNGLALFSSTLFQSASKVLLQSVLYVLLVFLSKLFLILSYSILINLNLPLFPDATYMLFVE